MDNVRELGILKSKKFRDKSGRVLVAEYEEVTKILREILPKLLLIYYSEATVELLRRGFLVLLPNVNSLETFYRN